MMHDRREADLIAQGERLLRGTSTFRGPLLPARRHNPKLPKSLHAFGGFAVIAIAHEIETRYCEAVREAGISLRDFVVLAELAQRPGISQHGLARRIGIGRSRLSEQLTVLATAGYIDRLLDDRDLRRRLMWITKPGAAVLAESRELIADADRRWFGALSKRDRAYFQACVAQLPPHVVPRRGWSPATSAGRP